METFLKLDINFFCIILLLILYFTIKLRKQAIGTSHRLFFKLLWMTVLLLILEVLSWTFDRIPGQNVLNYFFNMLFCLSTSLVIPIIASYLDYHIYGSYERLKKRHYYIHPFILTGILLTINIFKPILFSISIDNVYQRESFMFAIPIINISIFIYLCYLAYKRRTYIQKEVIWVIFIYTFIPAVTAFIQIAVFGIFILWPMMAVTVVLTYIFLETISTSRDYLTGLFSRHRIDDYLEYLLQHNKPFIIVMIDLDKFKNINDKYGHLSGDLALKAFANSLSSNFKKEKVVGRYAGDEFILILDRMNLQEMEEKLSRVRFKMKELYDCGQTDFLVSFSYGYYKRKCDENISYEDIINKVDKMMYCNKELAELSVIQNQ